jgi:predicted RNA-binding protein YlqC (UPF0109 family)
MTLKMESLADESERNYGAGTSSSQPSVSVILTIRLLMQGKEVGSIIGKRGDHIKQIREKSGAKINISDGSCPERIVTVTGSAGTINRSFSMICRKFEEDLQALQNSVPKPPITMRLIVPATQCGSLIGKGGSKIKEIRERTGASIQVASEMLPSSTERAVTISGTCEAIVDCMQEICQILLEAPPKGATLPFRPKPSYNPLLIASSAAAAAAAQQQATQGIAALIQQQQQMQQQVQALQGQNVGASTYNPVTAANQQMTALSCANMADLARLQPYIAVSRFGAAPSDLTSALFASSGGLMIPSPYGGACQFPSVNGQLINTTDANLLQKEPSAAAFLWPSALVDESSKQQQQQVATSNASQAQSLQQQQQQQLELLQSLGGQPYVVSNGAFVGRTMGVGGTALKSDSTNSANLSATTVLPSTARRFSPY